MIYYAQLDTPNFEFSAVAHSEAEALDAIRIGWTRWRRICKRRGDDTSSMWKWADLVDDVSITEMKHGKPYMDREELKP